jgi:hypothetical protein
MHKQVQRHLISLLKEGENFPLNKLKIEFYFIQQLDGYRMVVSNFF